MNAVRIIRFLLTVAVLVAPASAQSIVSARSGALHHVEGTALMDGERVIMEFAKFPSLAEGSVLETAEGRAEMLLTPGATIRLAEDSSVKMLSNRLTDTQLEFQDGSALVEAVEMLEGNGITVRFRETAVTIEKAGLYRFDSDPAQFRVYKGKAIVVKGAERIVAKKGSLVEMGAFLVAGKFNPKQDDSLYRWSARRSSYLASANMAAANSMSFWGMPWRQSGWFWNPYFGMMTYIPAGGMYRSPFGYRYFSPFAAAAYFAPRPRMSSGWGGGFNPNRGYTVVGSRSASTAGRSSGGVSASGSAGAASSSPTSRGGGGAVGRGGTAGGRGR